jgi:hypothetical protein
MVRELSKLLLKNAFVRWDYKTNHIACLAHVINLATQSFLKGLNVTNVTDEERFEKVVARRWNSLIIGYGGRFRRGR